MNAPTMVADTGDRLLAVIQAAAREVREDGGISTNTREALYDAGYTPEAVERLVQLNNQETN